MPVNAFRACLKAVERVREQSIVFVGCIRDIEQPILEENIARLRDLSTFFKKSSFVFVINDTTVSLPKDFEVLDYVMAIPPLGGGRDEPRVKWMSIFRNIYLEYVRKMHPDYDYMTVIDMDIHDFSKTGFLSSFGYDDWNCISSNGVQLVNNNKDCVYYDSFTFLNERGHPVNGDIPVFRKDGLLRICSGFGGIATYKIPKIQGKYGGMYSGDYFLCEHSSLNYFTGNHYLNTNQVTLR